MIISFFTGGKKSNFDPNNTTLELRKVPRELNNIAKLNEHFSKFGTIVNLQVRKITVFYKCLVPCLFNAYLILGGWSSVVACWVSFWIPVVGPDTLGLKFDSSLIPKCPSCYLCVGSYVLFDTCFFGSDVITLLSIHQYLIRARAGSL